MCALEPADGVDRVEDRLNLVRLERLGVHVGAVVRERKEPWVGGQSQSAHRLGPQRDLWQDAQGQSCLDASSGDGPQLKSDRCFHR